MEDKVDKKVFGFVNNKPDYTGKSAQKYIDKFTNRPEDAGNLEDIQNMLSDIGTIFEPADVANSLLYAAQGDFKKFSLNALYAFPVLGNLKLIKKMEKAIEQRKFFKSYVNVIKAQKKYGKYPKREDFPIQIGGPGKPNISEYDNFIDDLKYFNANYSKHIKDITGVPDKMTTKQRNKLDDLFIKLDDLMDKGS